MLYFPRGTKLWQCNKRADLFVNHKIVIILILKRSNCSQLLLPSPFTNGPNKYDIKDYQLANRKARPFTHKKLIFLAQVSRQENKFWNISLVMLLAFKWTYRWHVNTHIRNRMLTWVDGKMTEKCSAPLPSPSFKNLTQILCTQKWDRRKTRG